MNRERCSKCGLYWLETRLKGGLCDNCQPKMPYKKFKSREDTIIEAQARKEKSIFKAQDRTAERIEVGMTLNNAVNIIIAQKEFSNDALLKAMNLVWNTLQEFKQTTEKPVTYESVNEEIQVEVEQNKEDIIPF